MLYKSISQSLHWLRKLHPSYGLMVVIIAVGIGTDNPSEQIVGLLTPIAVPLNHAVMVSMGLLVSVALLVILSPAGRIRLGGEKPSYSLPAWLAMLFAAGMGIGLVFSGFAEPLLHFKNTPDEGSLSYRGAASHAMVITLYHWGLHAWALYGLAALTIAYFSYCKNQPMLSSSPLNFLLAKPLPIGLRRAIDSIAMVAALFGVAASLAQGTWLIERGIDHIWDMQSDSAVWILLGIVVAFILSAMSGIGRGIKWLSSINMWLAVALLVGIWWVSDVESSHAWRYLIKYLTAIPALSFDTYALTEDDQWLATWSRAYMIWWVAWTPFVGIFIARISRGYTIRTFMLGVMVAPVAFSIIWFIVFAEAGFAIIQNQTGADIYTLSDMPGMSFAILDALPYSIIMQLLVVSLVVIFLVTSADSGSYILGMFAHDGKHVPPRRTRLGWGIVLSIVSYWLLLRPDGMVFIRHIITITALPFLLILWLQILALLKALYLGRRQ